MDLRRLSGLYHSPIKASGVHTAKGRKEGVYVCACVCVHVCRTSHFASIANLLAH